MSAVAQVIQALGVQPGSELAVNIGEQLATAETLALRRTTLASNDRADGTKLTLVSREGIASATFTYRGASVTASGTCNKGGAYVCFSKQEPPRVPGPYEFIVEGSCIRVYRLKQLVWECGE